MPQCPLCGSELIERVERKVSLGSNVVGTSVYDYSGSIDDIYIAAGSEISIRYYKCSNPDCPYRKIIETQ
jgi:hypothetical protein